jgi:hypothetical protein
MYLEYHNSYIQTSPSVTITNLKFSLLQNALYRAYKHLGGNLISDFQIDGKWVKTVRQDGIVFETLAYRTWKNMIGRCNKNGAIQRKNPTYVGCTVSENFKDFQWFAEWCQNQYGYGKPGYELDKDILKKHNKIYSESTCVFVPKEINLLLNSSRKKASTLPIGVSCVNGKYVAHCSDGNGNSPYIATFATAKLASKAYKRQKTRCIRQKAKEYKSSLDPRAYEALMNYRV